MKDVDLEEPTSFLDHVYLGCTQRECQLSKDIVDNYPGFLLELLKNSQKPKFQGNLMRTLFLHGPMTWKVVQGNAWKDISNWQTKQLNSYTKSQHHALTTINSKRKT